MNLFRTTLKYYTTHKDRHIKGHASALLKRLQELNPQDDKEEAHYCYKGNHTVYGNDNVDLLENNMTICHTCKYND